MQRQKTIKNLYIIFAVTVLILSTVFFSLLSNGLSLSVSAYSEADYADAMQFKVDTDKFNFINGNTYNATNIPTIRLVLTGEQKLMIGTTTTFWYYETQSIGTPDKDDSQWKQINSPIIDNEYVDFSKKDSLLANEYYCFYVYFMVKLETGDVDAEGNYISYKNINDYFIELVIQNISDISEDTKVDTITATYYNNNGQKLEYDVATVGWASTSITFEITSRTPSLPVQFCYAFADDEGELVWFNASLPTLVNRGNGDEYISTVVIEETYKGAILFASLDTSGQMKVDQSRHRRSIMIDVDTPVFEVKAEMQIEGASSIEKEYKKGTYSAYNVVYMITPKKEVATSESRMGSPIVFYYNNGQMTPGTNARQWEEMQLYSDGTYRFEVTSTTTRLCFKGKNEAGRDSSIDDPTSAQIYETRIDKVKPIISLSATDARPRTVLSAGSSASGQASIGFATDFIRFLATNQAVDQQSSVYFDYAIIKRGGIDVGTPVFIDRRTSSPYEVILSDTYVETTFRFRATSEANLQSYVDFTVSVLKKDYFFEWAKDLDLSDKVNADGWAKDYIEVEFKLANVMDRQDEYQFYSQITGTSTERPLTIKSYRTEIENNVKYSYYTLEIDTLLNNQYLDFFVYNIAGDRSKFLTSPHAIKLDFVDPSANLTKRVVGGSINLSEDDWAKGNVNVILTPTSANISGLTCYPVIGANNQHQGGEWGKVVGWNVSLGAFVFEAKTTQTAVFELVSGAGRVERFIIEVKIDTTQIIFEGIEASVKSESYQDVPLTMDVSNEYYTATQTVSSDVTISFKTNHIFNNTGHFNYYYQEYSGANPDPAAYIRITDRETLIIAIASREANKSGTLRFAFQLETKAIDLNGNREKTRIIYLTIKYDIQPFEISVDYDGKDSENFREEAVFSLGVITEGVTITKYQYRIRPLGGVYGKWEDVPVTPVAGGYTSFTFNGVPHFDSDINEELLPAFNGHIDFRAVNFAGQISIVFSELRVRVDSSTPMPINAVTRSPGSTKYTNGVNILVYSAIDLTYNDTANKYPYTQYAPIDYYYISAEDWKGQSPPIDQNGMTRLTGSAAFDKGKFYYIMATNGLKRSEVYSLQIEVNKTQPTATLSVGSEAAIGMSGVYEFNWRPIASVTINAFTYGGGEVYIMYRIVENRINGQEAEWAYYGTSLPQSPFQTLYFMGSQRQGYDGAVDDYNFDSIVEFKVIDLYGHECEFTGQDKVRIRIDERTPYFDINTALEGNVELKEADRALWQSSQVYINIVPVYQDEHGIWLPFSDTLKANPGGVDYTYRINNQIIPEKLPGSGTSFSTDDLANSLSGSGFDGNGEILLQIIATARQSGKTHDITLTLRIDKVRPEFELRGEVTRGANSEYIDSGIWTNCDEVAIYLFPKGINKSAVTYTIMLSTNNSPETWSKVPGGVFANLSPRHINNMCVVTVWAESDAGLIEERTFEVKIDTQAPIISSGIITNAITINELNEEVIDRLNPNTYYIDQMITYEEANIKSAHYNNFPLPNGFIIGTNTVDNSNTGGLSEGKGGYVHIIIEDMAGNKAELIFYMTVFELDVNTITLSANHKSMLEEYENQFTVGKSNMSADRAAHFEMDIRRLRNRIGTLEKEVAEYRLYLAWVDKTALFTLIDDYYDMKKYIDYFESPDWTIVYPDWQQELIKEGVYGSYYQKLKTNFAELDTLMQAVFNVENKTKILPALNIVARSDYKDILNVYNAYLDLNNAQQGMFTPELYKKLIDVKRTCEVLLLQDENTGISIMGDDLASGVEIVVRDYPKSTGHFNSTQQTLLNTEPEGSPRAIIYMKELLLSDMGSQYETGEITITLPIPDEYKNYIDFAVFKVVGNTLVRIENVTINAMGDAVYFTQNSLATYVLAVNADISEIPQGSKVYATVFDIEIDATLLTYITVAAVGLFSVMLLIVIIFAIKHRSFVKKYNKSYKRSLTKKGIEAVPKGNAAARTNPASIQDKLKYD